MKEKGIGGSPSMGASLMISEGRWAERSYYQRLATRKILVGYPILTPFKNKEELDKYFESDKITCLLCGKAYKALPSHLAVHEYTEREYKKKYKIPTSYGLIGSETRQKYIETAKKRLEQGLFDPQKMGETVKSKYARGEKRNSLKYVSVLQEANNPKKRERIGKYSKQRALERLGLTILPKA